MSVRIIQTLKFTFRWKKVIILKLVGFTARYNLWLEKGRGMKDASRDGDSRRTEGRAGRYDKLDSTGTGPCPCTLSIGLSEL